MLGISSSSASSGCSESTATGFRGLKAEYETSSSAESDLKCYLLLSSVHSPGSTSSHQIPPHAFRSSGIPISLPIIMGMGKLAEYAEVKSVLPIRPRSVGISIV